MITKQGLQEKYNRYAKINSEDEYSKACIDAIELVAKALDDGASPEEANLKTHGLGLTGFMAGEIFKAIAYFHPRGEEVNKWWNKMCGGTGKEKGTINPAIITIGK